MKFQENFHKVTGDPTVINMFKLLQYIKIWTNDIHFLKIGES